MGWSYGVVLWEIMSYAERPYGNISNKAVLEMVEKGERLREPEGCPPKLYRVMQSCWAADHRSRPTFPTLATVIQGLIKPSADVDPLSLLTVPMDEDNYLNVNF
eukprot:Colp12_sorted_trinity150504_noHs@33443